MKEIGKKLNDLVNLCESKVAELDKRIADSKENEVKLNDFSLSLKAKEAALEGRETAIKHIENAADHYKEADALMEQARASMASAESQVKSFTEYEDSAKKAIIIAQEANAKKTIELAKKEADLEATILKKVQSALKG